jgi:hypothetical protein
MIHYQLFSIFLVSGDNMSVDCVRDRNERSATRKTERWLTASTSCWAVLAGQQVGLRTTVQPRASKCRGGVNLCTSSNSSCPISTWVLPGQLLTTHTRVLTSHIQRHHYASTANMLGCGTFMCQKSGGSGSLVCMSTGNASMHLFEL